MMSKTALLFPGQGSQYVGMGSTLCASFPAARARFDEASAILGFDLLRVCTEGPDEELRKTHTTQPALFVKSLAAWEVVKDVLRPDFAAGHSLGEYSALAAAGAISFADGVRAVRKRGELMWESGTKRPGTMAAILGISPEEVNSICAEASAAGVVQSANLNSPGQIVISGETQAVERAVEIARARGARKAMMLNVSGAFHSALMADARQDLEEFLKGLSIRDAAFPVYANASAGPVQDAASIRRLLGEQMTSPVRWEESMRALLAAGANEFYEVGAGSVLKGILRQIDKSAACTCVGTAESVEALRAAMSGGVR
jgi:[acyl-carrier-protein] S-malonyltransferase